MDKYTMREWVSALEAVVDNKLKKWKKDNRIENGEAVHLSWQYEQTHIHLTIFWEDRKELVKMECLGPRAGHSFQWHGLDTKTLSKIVDRVGNLSLITMHPPVDPTD